MTKRLAPAINQSQIREDAVFIYPNVSSALITNIAETGTKAEAVAWLQKQWNEICWLTGQCEKLEIKNNRLREALARIASPTTIAQRIAHEALHLTKDD